MKLLTFIMFGSIALILFYMIGIEPYRIVVKTKRIKSEKCPISIRIIQLSDLHLRLFYGEFALERIVKIVNRYNPTIVVFTGDLSHDIRVIDQQQIKKILKKIRCAQKIAVYGNHDYRDKVGVYELLSDSGFYVLENESIEQKGIVIHGLDDALKGCPSEKSFLLNPRKYQVLLTHEPDVADRYLKYEIDLILSGHSHGGQIRLPRIKPIATSLAKTYTSGLYKLNAKTLLYVNQGLGTSRLPFRFCVPPEITVIDVIKNEMRYNGFIRK